MYFAMVEARRSAKQIQISRSVLLLCGFVTLGFITLSCMNSVGQCRSGDSSCLVDPGQVGIPPDVHSDTKCNHSETLAAYMQYHNHFPSIIFKITIDRWIRQPLFLKTSTLLSFNDCMSTSCTLAGYRLI